MKPQLLTATGALAALMLSQSANAGTIVVSTIVGAYDNSCETTSCGGIAGITSFGQNSSVSYDTPALYIYNPTAFAFTGATLTLSGYQGENNGVVKTITLPTIAAGELYRYVWVDGFGGTVKGDLTSYDYDDSYGETVFSGQAGFSSATPDVTTFGNFFCGQGTNTITSLCSYVGNFDVKFSATWNGTPIAADFSPNPLQDGGNVAGTFVGWEGLDPNGLSETFFDTHTQTFPGTLAVITTGTTGSQRSSVPEPGTALLFGAGLGALTMVRRRRRAKTS